MRPGNHVVSLALVGVGSCCVFGYLVRNGVDRNQRIEAREDTVGRQQSSAEELVTLRADSLSRENAGSTVRGAESHTGAPGEKAVSGLPTANGPVGSFQILKDLESGSGTDGRSYLEKLQELLSGGPTEEMVAITSRFIFDKSDDRQGLPDDALQSIYASQSDPDLRRVIAQVLSQRGNYSLLNNQIADEQARLMSDQPRVRHDALAQLARMHSTKAVDAIAPFLQDPDTTVRLEALFALRDTGNQQHAHLVEALTADPEPSVSALAGDVLSSLRNLSASARTSYSRAEIEAELPPIANP